MANTDTLGRIVRTGVVPVVRASSADEARQLIEAILAGGLDIIELTMTVPGAIELMSALSRAYGERVVLGAGTVLDSETARACLLAGARFVVSPILDLPTIECCRTYSVPAIPGALTPTEIVRAWRAGASMVKVFPCSAMGGASYLKSLKAPFPQIELIPTGGVSLATVPDFVHAGATALGAGADLVDLKKLRAGDTAAITEQAKQYLQAIAKARADAAA
jgi:2-dehydro-3-deoxyphosphogluconate aldolase / (4S)-4-hydroxy-2-oxoglutarate aldolase